MIQQSPVDSLISFSNHSMPVVGMVNLNIKWNVDNPPFIMSFFVVESTQVYFPVVIGLDSMMKHNLVTSFHSSKKVLKTKFTMQKPYVAEGNLVTCFKQSLYTAEGTITLEPGETKFCNLILNNVNPFSHKESVLISCETFRDDIRVIPTLNVLGNKPSIVCVTNFTMSRIHRLFVFDVELYNPKDYRIIPPYASADLAQRKIINSVCARKLTSTRCSTIKVNTDLSTDQFISSSFKHFSLSGHDTTKGANLNETSVMKYQITRRA